MCQSPSSELNRLVQQLLTQQKQTEEKVEILTQQLVVHHTIVTKVCDLFFTKENGEVIWKWANDAEDYIKKTTGKEVTFVDENFWEILLSAQPCTSIFTPAPSENTASKSEREISTLISKLDFMQTEINKNNLIYYGVSESESENESDLFSKIVPLLPPAESSPVTIFTTRMGKKKEHGPNRPRPVKVNFPNLATRQAAWNARFSFKGSPHSVSEDLPLSIRIQRATRRMDRFPTSGAKPQEPCVPIIKTKPPVSPLDPYPTSPTKPAVSPLDTNPTSPPAPRPIFSPRRKTQPVTSKPRPFFNITRKKGKRKKKFALRSGYLHAPNLLTLNQHPSVFHFHSTISFYKIYRSILLLKFLFLILTYSNYTTTIPFLSTHTRIDSISFKLVSPSNNITETHIRVTLAFSFTGPCAESQIN